MGLSDSDRYRQVGQGSAMRLANLEPNKTAKHYKALMSGKDPPQPLPKVTMRPLEDVEFDDAAAAAVIDLEAEQDAQEQARVRAEANQEAAPVNTAGLEEEEGVLGSKFEVIFRVTVRASFICLIHCVIIVNCDSY